MVSNVPTALAAKLMHKNLLFVRVGLQQGIFPFGWAVKTGGRYSYYISSDKFEEFTGIKVTEEDLIGFQAEEE